MDVFELEMNTCNKGQELDLCDVYRYLQSFGGFHFEILLKTVCEGVFESRRIIGSYSEGRLVQSEKKIGTSLVGQHHSLTLAVGVEDTDLDGMLFITPSRDCQLHVEKIELLPCLDEAFPDFDEKVAIDEVIKTLREAPEASVEFKEALQKLTKKSSVWEHLPSLAAIVIGTAVIIAVLKI